MKRIFKNATLLPTYGFENRAVTVAVENHKILSVGEEPIAPAAGDESLIAKGICSFRAFITSIATPR